MNNSFSDIDKLSAHLFWDVDQKKCTWKDNSAFIVERVLDYGLWEDWCLLSRNVSIDEIAEIASQIKNLTPRSLYFISEISKKPVEDFRCYTLMQSIPQHWNF